MWCLFVALVAVPPGSAAEDVAGLETVLNDIKERFPSEVASDAVYRAALEGVAAHLGEIMGIDDNRVLTTEEQKAQDAWMRGHRVGIGAEFSILTGRGLVITEVFEEGPAQQAGLQPGDLVVSMDDHPLTGLGRMAIHARTRKLNSEQTVFDVRRNDTAIHRLNVQRGDYTLPAVRMGSENTNATVARVPFFGVGTAKALARFLSEEVETDAVVLDLRDNSGGRLEEAVEAADLFLDQGSIVVQKGKERSAMVPVTAENPPHWARHVVVLVNQGTRGVAEAFAAALQDNGRAVVVGTRTGGRAVDTSVYPAGRGLVLQVADIHLASPSGKSWALQGLVPNVVVESDGLTVPVGRRIIPPDLQRETAIRLISTGVSR